MMADELIFPVCDEFCNDPQPVLNADGRWVCGACWFACDVVVDLQPKPEAVEEVTE